MKRRWVIVVVGLLVVVAVGGVGFAVFEHFDRAALAKDAGRACGGLDTPTGGLTLPAGLTLPVGQRLLRVQTQGRTTVATASTAGNPGDIVRVRDRVLAALEKQGYRVTRTDQEPGYEAEAQLAGTAGGSLRVRPLCSGRLEIRYRIEG